MAFVSSLNFVITGCDVFLCMRWVFSKEFIREWFTIRETPILSLIRFTWRLGIPLCRKNGPDIEFFSILGGGSRNYGTLWVVEKCKKESKKCRFYGQMPIASTITNCTTKIFRNFSIKHGKSCQERGFRYYPIDFWNFKGGGWVSDRFLSDIEMCAAPKGDYRYFPFSIFKNNKMFFYRIFSRSPRICNSFFSFHEKRRKAQTFTFPPEWPRKNPEKYRNFNFFQKLIENIISKKPWYQLFLLNTNLRSKFPFLFSKFAKNRLLVVKKRHFLTFKSLRNF